VAVRVVGVLLWELNLGGFGGSWPGGQPTEEEEERGLRGGAGREEVPRRALLQAFHWAHCTENISTGPLQAVNLRAARVPTQSQSAEAGILLFLGPSSRRSLENTEHGTHTMGDGSTERDEETEFGLVCFARRSLEAVSEFVGSSHLRLVLGSGFPPTIFNIFATFRISTFSGLWSELASDVEIWREPFETNFKLRMSETATNRICGEKPRKQAAESALPLFLSSSPNSTKPKAALVTASESHGPCTNVSERCNVIPYTHFALLEMIDSNSRF